jgi:hypothetical protein
VIAADLILAPPAERSREIAARVARARAMQAERYAAIGLPQLRTNADANGPPLEEMARTGQRRTCATLPRPCGFPLAAITASLRVARTLADLTAPIGWPRAPRRGLIISRACGRGAPRGVSAHPLHSRRNATSSTRWLSTFFKMRSARWRALGRWFANGSVASPTTRQSWGDPVTSTSSPFCRQGRPIPTYR